MFPTKYKKYTKRIISIVILLQVALIFNKEGSSLNFTEMKWEDEIQITDEKDFAKNVNHSQSTYSVSFFGNPQIKIEPLVRTDSGQK